MNRAQGFAEQGAQVVWTAGIASTTVVQASAPYATIRVYLTGTTTLATIFSDNQVPPTPMANPFQANQFGYWFFYAPDGRYDVMIVAEAEGWTWTIGDVYLQDLYSWGRDVNANGHNLSNVGQLTGNSAVLNSATIGSLNANQATIGSLNANSAHLSSIQVDTCILWENAAGWYSACIGADGSLLFSNSNQPVLLLTHDGLVGVGMVIPQAELEVGGMIRVGGLFSHLTTGSGLELGYQPAPNQLGIVQAYDRTAHAWLPIVIDGSLTQLNPNSGGNVTMCLQGGNVGIGTGEAGPLAKFEAAGTIRITNDIPVPGSGQGLELGYQTFPPLGIVQAYDRTAGQWIPIVIDGNGVDINPNTTGNLQLCRGGGNVGIGGAFGNFKLDVNGDINLTGSIRRNGVVIL